MSEIASDAMKKALAIDDRLWMLLEERYLRIIQDVSKDDPSRVCSEETEDEMRTSAMILMALVVKGEIYRRRLEREQS